MNNDEICKEETDFTCYGNKSPVIRKRNCCGTFPVYRNAVWRYKTITYSTNRDRRNKNSFLHD